MGLVLSATPAPLPGQGLGWARPPLPARAMAPRALPAVQQRGAEEGHPAQALASEGELRYVWHGRYGDMLIEVRGGEVFVNGQRVERHRD